MFLKMQIKERFILNILISEKQYEGIYRQYKGSEVKTDISLYNAALVSSAKHVEDIKFIVYSDDNGLKGDKDYCILGVGSKDTFWGLKGMSNFVYLVELIDDNFYYQNSRSGCISGKVIEQKKFKMNFDFRDVTTKKNTFLNFIQEVGYSTSKLYLETFAIQGFRIKLLENIFRYKKKYFEDYSNEEFQELKKSVIKKVSIKNPNREKLLEDIQNIEKFKDLADYIEINREKLLNNSDLLYNRNENIQNKYPINMAGMNVNMDLYDGFKFNSAMPFYFQYRNYKQSTETLLEAFMPEIEVMEERRFENSLKVAHWIYGKEAPTKDNKPELAEINTIKYGLYFPLFMNFRQSIELAFKLIFVNEDLKKQRINTKKELSDYAQPLKTHKLPKLLFLIKEYLEDDVYEFLLNLSSFIYYNEGTDDSFSRYLVDRELGFDKLKPIRLYYVDLKNYIIEFYQVMEEVFRNMNFGFDIDRIFT